MVSQESYVERWAREQAEKQQEPPQEPKTGTRKKGVKERGTGTQNAKTGTHGPTEGEQG